MNHVSDALKRVGFAPAVRSFFGGRCCHNREGGVLSMPNRVFSEIPDGERAF